MKTIILISICLTGILAGLVMPPTTGVTSVVKNPTVYESGSAVKGTLSSWLAGHNITEVIGTKAGPDGAEVDAKNVNVANDGKVNTINTSKTRISEDGVTLTGNSTNVAGDKVKTVNNGNLNLGEKGANLTGDMANTADQVSQMLEGSIVSGQDGTRADLILDQGVDAVQAVVKPKVSV